MNCSTAFTQRPRMEGMMLSKSGRPNHTYACARYANAFFNKAKLANQSNSKDLLQSTQSAEKGRSRMCALKTDKCRVLFNLNSILSRMKQIKSYKK